MSSASASSSPLMTLREDIRRLEKLFFKKSFPATTTTTQATSSNSSNVITCFRIISASVNELVCELIDTGAKKYRINANICVITKRIL